MAAKYIPDETWAEIEKAAVKATACIQKPVSGPEMLQILLRYGLENLTKEDLDDLTSKESGA